jgi:hypothetical protein
MPGRIGERVAPWLAWLACLGLALLGLSGRATPVDPAAVPVLWARAQREAGADLAADPWLDVAKACARLRPWHDDFARCRARLDAIDEARR